jgi:hypothetical protein
MNENQNPGEKLRPTSPPDVHLEVLLLRRAENRAGIVRILIWCVFGLAAFGYLVKSLDEVGSGALTLKGAAWLGLAAASAIICFYLSEHCRGPFGWVKELEDEAQWRKLVLHEKWGWREPMPDAIQYEMERIIQSERHITKSDAGDIFILGVCLTIILLISYGIWLLIKAFLFRVGITS